MQEAAKVIAFLVEADARLFGQELGAMVIQIALGDDVLDARRRPN
jgi:hypothetical protein